MTPEQVARVLEAGWRAIPGKNEPAANALAIALRAMQRECVAIADENQATPADGQDGDDR